jgi:CRP/FNR family cyclic AMP-dependent transcriptional regulator
MLKNEEKVLIEKFLRKVPVFRNFSKRNLVQTIDSFSIRRIKKDNNIVFQSDESTDLYIVLGGRVRVTFMDQEGNEFILTTFKQGEFFGEMSLLDGKTRSASVTAEEATTLGVLKRERFLRAIKENSLIAFDLLTALVERLRKADEIIESFAFLDVRERIIKLLLERVHENRVKDRRGFYKLEKLRHKDIAARIGASREAVTKVLKALAEKHYILEENGYFLLAPSLLKKISIELGDSLARL